MKKILIIICLLFITGCSDIRKQSYDDIINNIATRANKDNVYRTGYSYYLPRGMQVADSTLYNEAITDARYKYYLYVDIVSYYYNKEVTYTENPDSYYSKIFNIDSKKAYLEINKENSKYLIEFWYNYSKIEAICDLEDINDIVLNASYILSTVKFNNNVIKTVLDDTFLVADEKYDMFESKKQTDDFLKLDGEEE